MVASKKDVEHQPPGERMIDAVVNKIRDDGWTLYFAVTTRTEGNKLEWDIHMTDGDEETLKVMLKSTLAKVDDIIAARKVH